MPFGPADAREGNRTLKLYFGHTGERGEFTFKRNGRYDRRELERINHFLRDWRKEESTRIDPELLDLVWEVYKEARAKDYIHVVSAYRSPKTNAMLRKRGRGVAKNSQHTRGKALDFYIPDVPIKKLRRIAMKKQGGGVGYYPSSGSPFVHLDTGSVRAWPRMSRKQLLALFPNGETLHLPSDGNPLPGYERAVAKLRRASSSSTTLAYLDTSEPENVDRTGAETAATEKQRGGMRAWLKRVFPGDGESGATGEAEAPIPAQPAGEPLIAATDDGLEPRRPRARPSTEAELAIAEVAPAPVSESLPAPTTVTPADARMMATLAYAPPKPKARPDPVFLAASLVAGGTTDEPLPVGSFAALTDEPQQATPSQAATDDPIARAFAALEELPSEEDRAVIAAFAAMRGGKPAPQQLTAASTSGVVIAPDGVPSYSADQDAMRGLIATPATYETHDPQFASLAMPVPAHDASDIYKAPTVTSEASVLGDAPDLPIDHFEVAERGKANDERGFFLRLFAGLIE